MGEQLQNKVGFRFFSNRSGTHVIHIVRPITKLINHLLDETLL